MSTPPRTAKSPAPAKINLTLHVTGQRDDGYHLLDSLVAFADISDEITVQAAQRTSLTVTGPMAEAVPTDSSNSVIKAAGYLGLDAAISLTKNLPSAAGIGGGTSDAAATIRALCSLYGHPLPAASDLVGLGADVPVCLTPTAQRMRGIGEQLDPVTGLPPVWAVLVNPGFPIPTGQIFHNLPHKNNAPMPQSLPGFRSVKEFCAWLWQQRNDLEQAAILVEHRVENVLKAISETSPLLTRMSGSGATCFGLYDSFSRATLAQRMIERSHPTWWVRDVQLT